MALIPLIGLSYRSTSNNPAEGFYGNAAASVLATLHRADDLRRRHRTASRRRDLRPQGVRSGPDPDRHFRRADAAWHPRSHAKESRGLAQLSDLGPYPV